MGMRGRVLRHMTVTSRGLAGIMGVGLLLDMVESGLGDRIALGGRKSGLTHADVVAAARGGAAVISERTRPR